MEKLLIHNAQAYALRRGLRIAERLGFGIHGVIFVAENNTKAGKTAVKAHRSAEPYFRERSVYERLSRIGVHELLGFNVPQSIAFDDELRVIEMTIVARPFVLDFAGAYLDIPPDFPEETWAEWEIEKREQFEERWPTVQTVLAALEGFDIRWWMSLPAISHFLTETTEAGGSINLRQFRLE
jgi:hypothetical protein